MEIVDRPVPKTLDIFVCQTSENKAFLAKRSNLTSRFLLGAPSTMTAITTWEETKVRVRRMHWEIRLKDDE